MCTRARCCCRYCCCCSCTSQPQPQLRLSLSSCPQRPRCFFVWAPISLSGLFFFLPPPPGWLVDASKVWPSSLPPAHLSPSPVVVILVGSGLTALHAPSRPSPITPPAAAVGIHRLLAHPIHALVECRVRQRQLLRRRRISASSSSQLPASLGPTVSGRQRLAPTPSPRSEEESNNPLITDCVPDHVGQSLGASPKLGLRSLLELTSSFRLGLAAPVSLLFGRYASLGNRGPALRLSAFVPSCLALAVVLVSASVARSSA